MGTAKSAPVVCTEKKLAMVLGSWTNNLIGMDHVSWLCNDIVPPFRRSDSLHRSARSVGHGSPDPHGSRLRTEAS